MPGPPVPALYFIPLTWAGQGVAHVLSPTTPGPIRQTITTLIEIPLLVLFVAATFSSYARMRTKESSGAPGRPVRTETS